MNKMLDTASAIILALLIIFAVFVLGEIAFKSFVGLCFVVAYVFAVGVLCRGLFSKTEYDGE